MVGGYTTNKNIYQTALVGGGTGVSAQKLTSPVAGTYANGIANLTPTLLSTSLNSVKTPTVKMPNLSSQFNGSVISVGAGGISGGSTGGVTKEGVITGNLGVTKMPTITSPTIKQPTTTLPNTTQVTYSDMLNMQTLSKASDNATTPVMSAQKTEAATTPTETAKPEQTTEKPATYEEYLEQQRDLLDKRKAEADKQAEAAKERAAVDAQASYEQNKATYGANAETMAQMGLQGGGYSDYINAQAYAQKRADVQQANATEQAAKTQNTATYENALSELNKSEIEYQEKQKEKAAAEEKAAEDKKGSIYASLWEGALNPDSGYTAESVAAIGREYGLSETQIKELQQIAADAKAKRDTEKAAAIKQSALDAVNNGSVHESNIDTYLDTLKGQGANDKDIADIKETYQSSYYNDYKAQITSGTLSSTKEVDDAFKAGNLSQEHYDNLKKAWNDDINTESNAFDNYDSYEAAKKDYEELIKTNWLSEENKSALEKNFKQYGLDYYKSTKSSGTSITTGNTITMQTPNGKHTITIAAAWNSVSSYDNTAQSEMVKNADKGQIFVYKNKVYIKLSSGKLGKIMDYAGDGAFEALMKIYKGSPYNLDNVK